MATLKLLEKLTTTAGVPGREHRVRKLIMNEIKGIFDSVSVDPLGSVIAAARYESGSSATSGISRSVLRW